MSISSLQMVLILPLVNLILTIVGIRQVNSKIIGYLKSLNFLSLLFFLFGLYLNNRGASFTVGSWLEFGDLNLNWTFISSRATSFVSLFLTLIYLFNFLSIKTKKSFSKDWKEYSRPALLFFILITACFAGNLFTFLFFYLLHTIVNTRLIDSSKGFSFEITALHFSDFLIIFSVLNLLGLNAQNLPLLNPHQIINDGFYLNCFLIGFLFKNFFASYFFTGEKGSFVKSWSGLYFVLLHTTLPTLILILKIFPVINFSTNYLNLFIYLGTLVFALNSLKALFENDFKKIFLYYVNGIKGVFLLSLGLNDYGVGIFLTISSALGLIPFLFLGDKLGLTTDKVPRIKESYRVIFKRNVKGNLYLLFSLFPLLLLPFLPQTIGYTHVVSLLEKVGLDYLLIPFLFTLFILQLSQVRLIFLVSIQKDVLNKVLEFDWQAWFNLILILTLLILLGSFVFIRAEDGQLKLLLNEWILGQNKIESGTIKGDSLFKTLGLIGLIPLGSLLAFGIYIFKGPFLSEKIERFQYRFSGQLDFLKGDLYLGIIIRNIFLPILKAFSFLFELIVQSIIYNKIFHIIGELVFESGVLLNNYNPKRLNSRLNYILFGTIVMFWILYLRLV